MFISSGKVGGYGKHGRQAIELAVDEINASGGILGRKLEAMVEDTKLKKDIAVGLAKKFINEDKGKMNYGKVRFMFNQKRKAILCPIGQSHLSSMLRREQVQNNRL